jgi:DNA-binding MarR family transcriptional regulator
MKIDPNKSDFNKTIAPWLGHTAKMMKACLTNVLQENRFDLTREQWIVLKILHEDFEGFPQNDLAQITKRNKASMTRLIDVMEKNHLVVRIGSTEDKRKKLIYITKTGKEIFQQTKPIVLNYIHNIEKGLSQEEKETLINILKKIRLNLENQPY